MLVIVNVSWFKLVLAIASLAILAYLGKGYYGELYRLKHASLALVPGLLTLYFLSRFFSAEALRSGLDRLGFPIGRGETFLVILLHTYASLLIPRVGYLVSAFYLKRRHGIPVWQLTTSLLAITVVQVICIAAGGLLCLGLRWYWMHQTIDTVLAFLFLGMLGMGAAALFSSKLLPEGNGPIGGYLRQLGAAWSVLQSDRRLTGQFYLLNILVLTFRALRLYLAFLAMGVDVDPTGVLLASLVGDVMFLLSLTPGALGFREAAISYAGISMGVDPSVALAVVLFDRLVWTLGVVVVAQFGMWKLTRQGPAEHPD